MNRPAILISLLASLLVGAALGLMGGIFFTHHMHARTARMGPGAFGAFGPGGPPHGGPRVHDPLRRLQRVLDLSPEQVKAIEPSVLETQLRVEAARESLHSRIEAELTTEQRKRWQQFRRTHPFPGSPRDPDDRAHRAPPGD